MIYVIPVTFVKYGSYEIEAETLLDALHLVEGLPLPDKSEYLDDSLRINETDVIESNTLPGGLTNLSDGDFEDLSEYINEQENS